MPVTFLAAALALRVASNLEAFIVAVFFFVAVQTRGLSGGGYTQIRTACCVVFPAPLSFEGLSKKKEKAGMVCDIESLFISVYVRVCACYACHIVGMVVCCHCALLVCVPRV